MYDLSAVAKGPLLEQTASISAPAPANQPVHCPSARTQLTATVHASPSIDASVAPATPTLTSATNSITASAALLRSLPLGQLHLTPTISISLHQVSCVSGICWSWTVRGTPPGTVCPTCTSGCCGCSSTPRRSSSVMADTNFRWGSMTHLSSLPHYPQPTPRLSSGEETSSRFLWAGVENSLFQRWVDCSEPTLSPPHLNRSP